MFLDFYRHPKFKFLLLKDLGSQGAKYIPSPFITFHTASHFLGLKICCWCGFWRPNGDLNSLEPASSLIPCNRFGHFILVPSRQLFIMLSNGSCSVLLGFMKIISNRPFFTFYPSWLYYFCNKSPDVTWWSYKKKVLLIIDCIFY